METAALVEWIVGAIFVGVNAYRRYNTPITNRESTTFQNFGTYFFFYLVTVLTLYVFCGALLDSSPETIGAVFGLLSGGLENDLPSGLTSLSAPMVSALFLTTLMPSLPFLSHYDQLLLNTFWDRGHIPNHALKMAAAMRRAPFNYSPRQVKNLKQRCKELQISYDSLVLDDVSSLDYRWARINVLLDSLAEWRLDDSGRLRRYMKGQTEVMANLSTQLEDINDEYVELRNESLEPHVLVKIERFLDKAIASLFRSTTVLAAKATCFAELSESGRRSRTSQLGFDGGSTGRAGLSGRQVVSALLAILAAFFTLSIIQELGKEVEYRRFGDVVFVTFLMFFTYGAALIISLELKRRVDMGYNELTSQRSWTAYVAVGLITALSWLIVTVSYRYIVNMLGGENSDDNIQQVFVSVKWSFPYALQSLGLAVSVSWILDFHQSQGMTGRLNTRQRVFDIVVMALAVGFFSLIAFSWMEGFGWFEGHATRDDRFIGRTPIGWFIVKGMAVAAMVGWLVPMWFYLNRTKAPDQIAGRLIVMNRRGLADEIRSLAPNQLIQTIAAVSATVASIDDEVSRNEKDVYQIICGQLAGVPNSDVDIDSAEREFDYCLGKIENSDLPLDDLIGHFKGMPLLLALLPFVASSVAFADGVYLEQEKAIVETIKQKVQATEHLN